MTEIIEEKHAEQKAHESKLAEFIGQIKVLKEKHGKLHLAMRTGKLKMIDELIKIKKTSQEVGLTGKYALSDGMIAEAYGKTKSWISKVFKTARSEALRKEYLDGRIGITGNETALDTAEKKIRSCHAELVTKGVKVINSTKDKERLAEMSGCTLDEVTSYLDKMVAKTLDDRCHEVKISLSRFLNFRKPKKGTFKVIDGKAIPVTDHVKDAEKVTTLSKELVEMVTASPQGGVLMSILERTVKDITASKKVAEIPETEETEETVATA